MSDLYADAPVPVRADLAEAHAATIRGWAAPGNHWTGAQRLAIVDQVRRAMAAEPLPPWVRPTTVDGLVDRELEHGLGPTSGFGTDDRLSGTRLPDAAIDAVWRLTTNPGTLTEDWYREIVDRGLTPEQYIELVAVVATATCLDVFATAIGVAPVPLPGPSEGLPDGRGAAVAVTSHWVPTVDGGGANVGKALSAVPVAMEAWQLLSAAQYVPAEALIKDLQWSRGALDRRQVELLAARTSLLNECFY